MGTTVRHVETPPAYVINQDAWGLVTLNGPASSYKHSFAQLFDLFGPPRTMQATLPDPSEVGLSVTGVFLRQALDAARAKFIR